MRSAGLTTSEFATRVGVSEDAVRKYFRGKDVPRLNRWPRIATVLGMANAREEGATHDPDVEPRKFDVLPC